MGTHTMDLNCDLGESFGHYTLGDDANLMGLVTSVNIACGFHAGDFRTMRQTVRRAIAAGVAIGAHPGYPDLQGFGRREMEMTSDDLECLVLYQVGALDAFVRSEGGQLHHVKAHGALYNKAARDRSTADAYVAAVYAYDPHLIVYAQAGSEMVRAAEARGMSVMEEAFVDRRYLDNGLLAPRHMPGSIVEHPADSAAAAVQIACDGQAPTVTGRIVAVRAKTLCLHGDGAHAAATAMAVREALLRAGVDIRPMVK